VHRLSAGGAAGGDEIGGAQERFEGAGVRPPAIEEREAHRAFADVGVVDVGDFEFVAAGGFAGMDLVEDRGVIHVNAGNRVIRFRVRGLFLDAFDAVAIELGDAEALGVGDFL
jgi:hypothetical protein